MDTVVGWQDGTPGAGTAASPASAPGRPPPTPEIALSVDDLPGLRDQAHELTELLDLGFHHGEVLGRLGTTISLGVLVTGPAGSGKSALVRAVAAARGRGGEPVWAPELAALTNDAAATRLRARAPREVRGRALAGGRC